MKNEIKPMSAEDILEEFSNLFPDSSPPTYDHEEHKAWFRNALAAYTKFLLEKMPNIVGLAPDGTFNPPTDPGIQIHNALITKCRSILQDQIDKLTK